MSKETASPPLLMLDNFSTTETPRGREISEEVYMHFLNILPPIRLNGVVGFQVSEPYCDRIDSRSGVMRTLYATFVARGDRYFYAGLNFRGEHDSTAGMSGPDCPPYLIGGMAI